MHAADQSSPPDVSRSRPTSRWTPRFEFRAQLKATGSNAPSFNDLIANAAALALREHPLANGIYRDGHFEQ